MIDYECYKTYEKAFGVTWRQLAAAEPELNAMLEQAREAGGCRNVEQVNRKFSPFKSAIHKLVGFFGKHKGHPLLGTQAAYEVVTWRLRNAVAGDS
jgi:hypothetical protein